MWLGTRMWPGLAKRNQGIDVCAFAMYCENDERNLRASALYLNHCRCLTNDGHPIDAKHHVAWLNALHVFQCVYV
jgi:hypothetical protein